MISKEQETKVLTECFTYRDEYTCAWKYTCTWLTIENGAIYQKRIKDCPYVKMTENCFLEIGVNVILHLFILLPFFYVSYLPSRLDQIVYFSNVCCKTN